jgi:hypothetical protein
MKTKYSRLPVHQTYCEAQNEDFFGFLARATRTEATNKEFGSLFLVLRLAGERTKNRRENKKNKIL